MLKRKLLFGLVISPVILGNVMNTISTNDKKLNNFEDPPEVQWYKNFNINHGSWSSCVKQTDDLGYILLSIVSTDTEDIWLIKTDKYGNEEWAKILGSSNYNEVGRSLVITSDGGYIIAGCRFEKNFSMVDFLVVKTDSNGNEIWNKTFDRSIGDICYSIQQTSDDGYILVGYTYVVNTKDIWLVKIDSNGKIVAAGNTTVTAGTDFIIFRCNTDGSLDSGSIDNVRWEITNANTGSGTFTINIRRGNDVTNEKVILETFANVSMDPEADNYVAKVIGDTYQSVDTTDANNPYVKVNGEYPNASRYVYVSAVNTPTPNYFDNSGNAKAEYTSSIPVIHDGVFAGGTGNILTGAGKYFNNIDNTDTQGLVAGNYSQAINLLKSKDDYQYNVITTPGLIHSLGSHTSVLNTLIANTQERGDALVVLDIEDYGATILQTSNSAGNLNSSYAATYWPWVQVQNPDTGKLNWVPASTLIPGVYAFNDNAAEPWFAPAGINRGGLDTVVRPERKLTRANRDTLYEANVNPIANFPANGTVVFGQKTLQKKASALDRVNVRRLLIALKSYIGQVANNLVFEQNSAATRNSFLAQVNPYMESVQQRQGVYAFKVVMDDSNNTPDVIDRNQLVGQIFLQPTRTAEFIILDFNVLPTGAEFPA